MKRTLILFALCLLPFSALQAQDADQVLKEFAYDKVESQVTPPVGQGAPAPVALPAPIAPVNPMAAIQAGALSVQHQADQLSADLKLKQEFYRFWEVIALTLMGTTSLIAVLWFMGRRADFTPQEVISASGVTLIIFATLLLVILADTDQQLTAAAGILGAMAGYLFRGISDQKVVRAEEAVRQSENRT